MFKTTAELKTGDTIKVWWEPKRDTIINLESYNGSLLKYLGEGTKIAHFALNKIGMTLEAGRSWEVIDSSNFR